MPTAPTTAITGRIISRDRRFGALMGMGAVARGAADPLRDSFGYAAGAALIGSVGGGTTAFACRRNTGQVACSAAMQYLPWCTVSTGTGLSLRWHIFRGDGNPTAV
jgi:hypothetical protein